MQAPLTRLREDTELYILTQTLAPYAPVFPQYLQNRLGDAACEREARQKQLSDQDNIQSHTNNAKKTYSAFHPQFDESFPLSTELSRELFIKIVTDHEKKKEMREKISKAGGVKAIVARMQEAQRKLAETNALNRGEHRGNAASTAAAAADINTIHKATADFVDLISKLDSIEQDARTRPTQTFNGIINHQTNAMARMGGLATDGVAPPIGSKFSAVSADNNNNAKLTQNNINAAQHNIRESSQESPTAIDVARRSQSSPAADRPGSGGKLSRPSSGRSHSKKSAAAGPTDDGKSNVSSTSSSIPSQFSNNVRTARQVAGAVHRLKMLSKKHTNGSDGATNGEIAVAAEQQPEAGMPVGAMEGEGLALRRRWGGGQSETPSASRASSSPPRLLPVNDANGALSTSNSFSPSPKALVGSNSIANFSVANPDGPAEQLNSSPVTLHRGNTTVDSANLRSLVNAFESDSNGLRRLMTGFANTKPQATERPPILNNNLRSAVVAPTLPEGSPLTTTALLSEDNKVFSPNEADGATSASLDNGINKQREYTDVYEDENGDIISMDTLYLPSMHIDLITLYEALKKVKEDREDVFDLVKQYKYGMIEYVPITEENVDAMSAGDDDEGEDEDYSDDEQDPFGEDDDGEEEDVDGDGDVDDDDDMSKLRSVPTVAMGLRHAMSVYDIGGGKPKKSKQALRKLKQEKERRNRRKKAARTDEERKQQLEEMRAMFTFADLAVFYDELPAWAKGVSVQIGDTEKAKVAQIFIEQIDLRQGELKQLQQLQSERDQSAVLSGADGEGDASREKNVPQGDAANVHVSEAQPTNTNALPKLTVTTAAAPKATMTRKDFAVRLLESLDLKYYQGLRYMGGSATAYADALYGKEKTKENDDDDEFDDSDDEDFLAAEREKEERNILQRDGLLLAIENYNGFGGRQMSAGDVLSAKPAVGSLEATAANFLPSASPNMTSADGEGPITTTTPTAAPPPPPPMDFATALAKQQIILREREILKQLIKRHWVVEAWVEDELYDEEDYYEIDGGDAQKEVEGVGATNAEPTAATTDDDAAAAAVPASPARSPHHSGPYAPMATDSVAKLLKDSDRTEDSTGTSPSKVTASVSNSKGGANGAAEGDDNQQPTSTPRGFTDGLLPTKDVRRKSNATDVGSVVSTAASAKLRRQERERRRQEYIKKLQVPISRAAFMRAFDEEKALADASMDPLNLTMTLFPDAEMDCEVLLKLLEMLKVRAVMKISTFDLAARKARQFQDLNDLIVFVPLLVFFIIISFAGRGLSEGAFDGYGVVKALQKITTERVTYYSSCSLSAVENSTTNEMAFACDEESDTMTLGDIGAPDDIYSFLGSFVPNLLWPKQVDKGTIDENGDLVNDTTTQSTKRVTAGNTKVASTLTPVGGLRIRQQRVKAEDFDDPSSASFFALQRLLLPTSSVFSKDGGPTIGSVTEAGGLSAYSLLSSWLSPSASGGPSIIEPNVEAAYSIKLTPPKKYPTLSHSTKDTHGHTEFLDGLLSQGLTFTGNTTAGVADSGITNQLQALHALLSPSTSSVEYFSNSSSVSSSDLLTSWTDGDGRVNDGTHYKTCSALSSYVTQRGMGRDYDCGGFAIDIPFRLSREEYLEVVGIIAGATNPITVPNSSPSPSAMPAPVPWLNLATRAVMVEYFLFHQNSGMLVMAKHLFEVHAGGGVTHTLSVVPFFLPVRTSYNSFIVASYYLFMAFLILYGLRLVIRAARAFFEFCVESRERYKLFTKAFDRKRRKDLREAETMVKVRRRHCQMARAHRAMKFDSSATAGNAAEAMAALHDDDSNDDDDAAAAASPVYNSPMDVIPATAISRHTNRQRNFATIGPGGLPPALTKRRNKGSSRVSSPWSSFVLTLRFSNSSKRWIKVLLEFTNLAIFVVGIVTYRGGGVSFEEEGSPGGGSSTFVDPVWQLDHYPRGYEKIQYEYDIAMILNAANIVLSVLIFLGFTQYMPRFSTVVGTIGRSIRPALALGFAAAMMLVGFAICATMAIGDSIEGYHTIGKSIVTLLSAFWDGWDYTEMNSTNQNNLYYFTYIYILFYVVVFIVFVLGSVLAVFADAFSDEVEAQFDPKDLRAIVSSDMFCTLRSGRRRGRRGGGGSAEDAIDVSLQQLASHRATTTKEDQGNQGKRSTRSAHHGGGQGLWQYMFLECDYYFAGSLTYAKGFFVSKVYHVRIFLATSRILNYICCCCLCAFPKRWVRRQPNIHEKTDQYGRNKVALFTTPSDKHRYNAFDYFAILERDLFDIRGASEEAKPNMPKACRAAARLIRLVRSELVIPPAPEPFRFSAPVFDVPPVPEGTNNNSGSSFTSRSSSISYSSTVQNTYANNYNFHFGGGGGATSRPGSAALSTISGYSSAFAGAGSTIQGPQGASSSLLSPPPPSWFSRRKCVYDFVFNSIFGKERVDYTLTLMFYVLIPQNMFGEDGVNALEEAANARAQWDSLAAQVTIEADEGEVAEMQKHVSNLLLITAGTDSKAVVPSELPIGADAIVEPADPSQADSASAVQVPSTTDLGPNVSDSNMNGSRLLSPAEGSDEADKKESPPKEGGEEEADKRSMAERSLEEMTRVNRRLFLGILALAHHSALAPPRMERVHVIAPASDDQAHAGDHPDHSTTHNAESHLHNSQSIHRQTSDVHSGAKAGHHRRRRHQDHADFAPPPLTYAYYGTLNETLFLSIVEDLRAKKCLPAYFDGVDFWHRNGLGGMIAAPGLHTKAFPPPPTAQQRKQWKVHHHHASMLRQGSVKLHNNTSGGDVKKQVSILKSGSSAYSENLSDMLYNHPHALNNPYLDPSAPQEPTCPLPPAHATLRYTHDPSFFRSRDRIIMSDFIPLIQNEYVIQSIGLKFQLDESLAFAVAAKRIVNQRVAKEYKTHTKKLQLQQKATQSAMKVSKFGGSDTNSAAPPSTASSYHSHYVPSFESFDSKRDTSDDKYLSVDEFSRAWCAAKGSFPSSKIINHISTFFKIGVQPLPAPPQPTQLAQQEPSSAPISPLSAQQLASASLKPIVDDPTTRIPTKIDWHLFTHACQADPQALSRQSFEHSLSLLLKRNWENNLWHGAFFFLLAFYSAFIILQCGGEAIHVTDSLKGTFAPSSDTPPQSSIDYTPDDDTDDSYVYHDVSDWVRQTVKSVWSEQSELELTVTKRGLFNTSADETTSTASIPFLSHHKSNFFVGAIRVMQWRVRPSSPKTCDSLYETYFGSANVKYESYTHSVDYTSYFNRQLSGPVNAAFEAWQKASPRTSAEIAARKALLESEQQLEAAYYRERVTSDFPLIAERYCVGPWGERGKREATRFGNGVWPGGLSNVTAEAEYYNFDSLSDEARNAFLFREFSDEISEERRVLKSTDSKTSSAKRAFSPSTFTTGLQRIEPDTLGNDGTYPSDGFYFDIPISATANQAYQLVDSVLLNNWIDRQTRLVMVRMVLYNPNLNLVTAGRFGFEMPSSGNTIAIAHVNSVSLSSSPIPFDNVFLPLCVILWIIVAFYWALVTASLFASRHANNRFASTELIYGRMRTILPATFLNIDEQLALNLSMLTLTLTLAWHTIMWSMYSDEVGGKYRSYLDDRDAGYTGTLFHTNYTTSSTAFSTAPNTTELNNANDFLFSGVFNATDSFNSNQRSSPFNPYHLSLANNNKFPVALERRSQYNSIIRSIEGFNYMVIVTTCMLFVSSRLRLDLLLKTITIASKDLISIAVLYIIVVIAFTVGMQQLWGYDSSSVYSFGSAFLSMFVGASTGGSLPDGTADTTRSVAGPIYQMAFLLIANSVLFNMVTAILTGTLAVVKESLYDPSLVASCLETYGCFDDESETAIVTPAPTGSGQVSSGSSQARGNGRDGNNAAVVSSMLLKMGDTKTRRKEGGDANNNAPAKKNSEPSKFLYFLRYIRYGIQRGLQILPTYIIKHTVLGFYTQWILNKLSRSRKEAGEDSMVANYTVDTATTVGGTSANHSPSVVNINQKKSAEGVPSPFSPTTKHPNPLDADHHEVTVAPTPTKSRGGGTNRTAQTSDVTASSSPFSVAVLFRLSFRMFWIYLEHWYALVDGGTPLEAVRGASNLVSIMAFMDAEERLESRERMVEELSELKQQLQRQKKNTSNPSRSDTTAEKKAGVLIPQSSAAWLWGGANDSDTDDEAVEMAHVLHSEDYADEEEQKEQDNLRVGNAAFAAQTLRRNTVGGAAAAGQSQEHRQATNDDPPGGGVNAEPNDNNAASPMSAFIRSNPRHRLFAYGQYRRLPIWDEFVFTNFKTQLSEFQNLFIRAPAFFFGESEASQWMVTFEERHYYNSMQEAFQYQGEDGEEDEGGDEGGSGGDDGGDDSSANASSYSSGMSGDNISNIRFLSSFGPSSSAPSRANSTMSTISAFLLGGGRGPEQDSDSEVEEGDDFFSGKLHSNSGSPLMNPSSGMYGSGGNYDPAPAATAAAGGQASPEQSIEMQRIRPMRLQADGKDNDDAFGDNMQVVESAAFELAEGAPGPMGPASMMMPPPPPPPNGQLVDTNLRVTKVKFHSSVVDNEGKAKPISIKQKQLDERKKQMEAEGAKGGVTGDNAAAASSAAAGMFKEADLPQQPEARRETNHDAYSYKEPQPEDNAPPSASESAPGSTDPAIAALMKKLPPEPQGELADFDAFDLDNYTYTYKGVTFTGKSEREFSLMVARVESEKKKDKAARDKIIKERATILKKIEKLKKKKANSNDNDNDNDD